MKKNKKKVIITGAQGQDGLILSKLFIRNKFKVIGIIKTLKKKVIKGVKYHKISLNNFSVLSKTLKKINPDIFENTLTVEQIQSWREKGYLLINNVIEPELLNDIKIFLDNQFPQIEENTIEELSKKQDFGSKGILEFPCKYNEINKITLSPRIINCVKTLLGHDDIRLIQSDVWAKYGGSNYSNIYSNISANVRAGCSGDSIGKDYIRHMAKMSLFVKLTKNIPKKYGEACSELAKSAAATG